MSADLTPDPIGNAKRKQIRSRRVPSSCETCGEDDPFAMVEPVGSLLESHHVAGRVNDATMTVWACRNCHGKMTERLRDLGVPLDSRSKPHILQRIYSLLRGIATAFERWASHLNDCAEQLSQLVVRLDEMFPGWSILIKGGTP